MKRTSLAQVMGKTARRRPEDVMVSWQDSKQLIGIEIEAENIRDLTGTGDYITNLPAAESLFPMWTTHADGSLRNGTEYVLSRPMAGSELASAIHMFFKEAKTKKALTSGTHIHVDMHDEDTAATAPQALYMLVYAIEPAIFGIIDPGREWCGYTNPLTSAPLILAESLLADNVESQPSAMIRGFQQGRSLKYYGLNFQPLSSYGSVEFRYFPTAENSDELIYWVNMVQAITKTAKRLETKEAAMEMVNDPEAYDQFMETVFGKDSKERALALAPHKRAVSRCRQALFSKEAAKGKKLGFSAKSAEVKRFGRFFATAAKTYRDRYGNEDNAAAELNVVVDLLRRHSVVHAELRTSIAAGVEPTRKYGDLLFASDGVFIWYGNWVQVIGNVNDVVYLVRGANESIRTRIYNIFESVENVVAELSNHPQFTEGASSTRVKVAQYITEIRRLAQGLLQARLNEEPSDPFTTSGFI